MVKRFKELLESKLGNVKPLVSEQQILKQRYGYDTENAPSDYLGKQGTLGAQQAKQFNFLKELSDLREQYPCLPTKDGNGESINPTVRDSLLFALKWMKENEQKVTQIFGISKELMYYLFRLALTAASTHGGYGQVSNENINRNVAKWGDLIFGQGADPFFRAIKGKTPSLGLYQMQVPVYREMKKTHEITGKSNITALYDSYIASTLATMEYFLNLYKQLESLGYKGPSIDVKGNPLKESTGDFNWDAAVSSYQWGVTKFTKKYCKTKNTNGTYNTDYAAPCDEKIYEPFKSEQQAKSSGRPYPGVLNVQQNEVI
ncbi:hypothetical protein EBU94_05720, partial [bacterium]|nr:hypothetical protein [bacterium]